MVGVLTHHSIHEARGAGSYWPNIGAQDERIFRHKGRMFVGLATEASGDYDTNQGGPVGSLFDWATREATFAAASGPGGIGVVGLARSSDVETPSISDYWSAMAVGGFSRNDRTDVRIGVWSLYGEGSRVADTGFIAMLETDVAELGGDNIEVHPWTLGTLQEDKISAGLWVMSGGSLQGAHTLYDASVGLFLGNNGARVKTGIVISALGLTEDGSGFSRAMDLSYGQTITMVAYGDDARVPAAIIRSEMATEPTDGLSGLIFRDGQTVLMAGGVEACTVTPYGINLAAGKNFAINNVQVMGPRITGWGVPTGPTSRASFNTATATLDETRQVLGQLIHDFLNLGPIGT